MGRYADDIIPAVEGTLFQERAADELADRLAAAHPCPGGCHGYHFGRFLRCYRSNGTHGGGRQLCVRKYECSGCGRVITLAVELPSNKAETKPDG